MHTIGTLYTDTYGGKIVFVYVCAVVSVPQEFMKSNIFYLFFHSFIYGSWCCCYRYFSFVCLFFCCSWSFCLQKCFRPPIKCALRPIQRLQSYNEKTDAEYCKQLTATPKLLKEHKTQNVLSSSLISCGWRKKLLVSNFTFNFIFYHTNVSSRNIQLSIDHCMSSEFLFVIIV